MRRVVLLMTVLPTLLLAGCGGGGGTVASTPTPPAAPLAPPPPPPSANYDTAEYRRSNAVVQAQASAAYVAGATGQGVVAAVIDSGVNQNSSEFAGRISSLSADLAGSRGLQDVGGHGTAVSEVLLGAKNDSDIHGVAYNATLLVARTDTPGSCNTPSASDSGCSHNDNAIAAGVDLAIRANARVINISLGGSPANSNLRAAIGRATTAGIVIVISAGNDYDTDPALGANPDPLAQIATDPIARGLVLIAGATDGNKTIASFSNRAGIGASQYLTALGVAVRSNDQTGTAYLYSGTSFSAPVVAGAVALLAQAFPNLTGAQIVDLLLRTATDLGATGTDSIYGRGELNIAKAFAPQGSTSLANSAVAVSLSSNGTLSTPMGDAGVQGGQSVPIRDAYGRDYTVDLAPTLARAPRTLSLTNALTSSTRQLQAMGASTAFALSIADATPERLLLDRSQLRSARALAGTILSRVDRSTALGFGFASGSDALDRGLSQIRAPAFLVADGRKGLDKSPAGALAIRRTLGDIAITLAAETGDLRLWERSPVGPRGDRYRRFAYGAVTLGLDTEQGPFTFAGRLTQMNEHSTILGARLDAALGGSGATSWFADARIGATLLPKWKVGVSMRRGWTFVPAGFARASSTIATQAFAFDVTRDALFSRRDSFALRIAEPLRVVGGGIKLIDIGTLSLSPDGHERDFEAVYARPAGPGWLTLNSYWRQQPDNFASAPNDLGAAMRFSLGF